MQASVTKLIISKLVIKYSNNHTKNKIIKKNTLTVRLIKPRKFIISLILRLEEKIYLQQSEIKLSPKLEFI